MKVEKKDKIFLLEAKEYEYPSNWNLKGQGFDFDTDWLIVSLTGIEKEKKYELEGAFVRLGELAELYENFVRLENGFLKEMKSSFVEPNLSIKAHRKIQSVMLEVQIQGHNKTWTLQDEFTLEEFKDILQTLFLEIEKCSSFM